MPLQTLFLQEFTKEIILSLTPKEIKTAQKAKPRIIILPRQAKQPSQIMQKQIVPIKQVRTEPIQISEPNYSEYYQELYLGKIINFILDPGINYVECPGPGKFISIKKMSKIMMTNVSLGKEEIDMVIDSFSEKSKIPRIGGTFKAIVNNLVITAIDSFSGPRFIISKTNPVPSHFL